MVINVGSRVKIRRTPSQPVRDAIVVGLNVTIYGDDKMGVRVFIEILEDGPRPNEQVDLGIFHLKMWMDWADEG